MSRDPNNTVKRLTDALECAVTGVEKVQRLRNVYQQLVALNPEDFPDEEARELFEKIVSYTSAFDHTLPAAIFHLQVAQCFDQLWRLYWLMSANSEYK